MNERQASQMDFVLVAKATLGSLVLGASALIIIFSGLVATGLLQTA